MNPSESTLRSVDGAGIRAQMVGESDVFKYLQFRIDQVGPTAATVLLLGETGTGKSLVARAIHDLSPQRGGRLVSVNCAAIPHTLLESELFGHERGAFTDARTSQVGRFELAHRGTLFLDEVGELTLEAQAKLLRFLQEGCFERLGSHQTVRVTVRVIAATNRDIHEEMRAGRFRRDLYFRLSVFPITVPPLRDRRVDIPRLVEHLVAQLAARNGKRITEVPDALLQELQAYDWPGNVRELENVLERAVITATDRTLRLAEPLQRLDPAPLDRPASDALVDVERAHILRILSVKHWRIEGRGGAADTLGLKPSTLRSRMRKLDIVRPPAAPRERVVGHARPWATTLQFKHHG
jgi:formate hydrogenlyase transcriptional activator